eukprot:TRINITY_DN7862_c0_g1_i3.p1 TRINITY_DN7862_c0_g1~~TRINITY_DN7862_c0_g1_i3.p1  ORF type:complete len:563 (-),score=157.71 TRINITY_DN7862_c0_g1_i3:104-1792(-)
MPARKKTGGLGKAIQNARLKKNTRPVSNMHTTEIVEEGHDKFKSVIDRNDLVEFLVQAELQDRRFDAIRQTRINNTDPVHIDLNTLKSKEAGEILTLNLKRLRIPRKPKWDERTSGEELRQRENDSFLNWRRELARIEETTANVHITPFEKNIEIWRQLWRVVERSDIVIQIVDGRDPLFFRCEDLEDYVKECDASKQNILLVNKADLLSDDVRRVWSEWFTKNKVSHIFFSAKAEQERIDKDGVDVGGVAAEFVNSPKIANRAVLLDILREKAREVRQLSPIGGEGELVTIGMAGFPNVGKSSLINVLCERKMVGVTSQPGKTKHFQTIYIEKDLLLCDCPGLVFPSLVSSRAEMVCNGVLPIDTIRDYWAPAQIIVMRIPKRLLEAFYHMTIQVDGNISASDLLSGYSKSRGYLTGRALPDEAKAAKIILKDYVSGKLLYCHLPPDYDAKENPVWQFNSAEELKKIAEKPPEEPKPLRAETKVEADFFEEEEKKTGAEDGELNEEEVALALELKEVRGLKLTKAQRREIKFAVKRGDTVRLKNEQVVVTQPPGKRSAELV